MPPIRLAIFRFVTRRFGRLRRVWILTQAFDFGLGLLTFFTAPGVTRGIRSLARSLRKWPDVKRSRHPLGGRQFNCRGTELGHVHSNGIVDLRLTASEQADVLARGLAHRHHIAPTSTWVTFVIEKGDDASAALSLFAIPFKRVTTPGRTPSELPSEEYGS
jgi:Family of unknown function (DUF5519)